MENTLKHKGKALVGAILLGIAVIGSAFIGKSEQKAVEKKADYFLNEKVIATVWFNAATSGSNTFITDEITAPTAPCDEIAGDLCAVQLDLQHVDIDVLQAFYDRMQDPQQSDPTLQEFLNAGATKTGESYRP